MKRPISITIISWLLIVGNSIILIAGLLPLSQRLAELEASPFESGVHVVRLIGIVCGVFMLRGRNWARWLLVAWIVFHVVICIFFAQGQVMMHSLFMMVLLFFLFRPPANAYF